MDTETLVRIGDNIRKRRTELGLSQTELANKVGVSMRTIQRIEKGETHMRMTIAISLSRALDVSIDSLL